MKEQRVKQLNNFINENIIKRKAMFIPILGVSVFMLVGYAAVDKEAPKIVSNRIEVSYGDKVDLDAIDITDNQDSRQARTLQTHPFLITQELSSISDAILNNVGEIFVGSLKSSKEIEFILEEMKLSNHPAVRGALIDHTQDEGVTEEKKYNFLMQDYNNRKCLTKNKIPRCFAEIFRTLKDEEESNQEQLDTDDKNVPVTGTFLNKKETGGLYDD